jgi:hypothetical protein
MRCAEHSRAIRFAPAAVPWAANSSAMNRYPNAGSVVVDAEGGVDQVGVVPVALVRRDAFHLRLTQLTKLGWLVGDRCGPDAVFDVDEPEPAV